MVAMTHMAINIKPHIEGYKIRTPKTWTVYIYIKSGVRECCGSRASESDCLESTNRTVFIDFPGDKSGDNGS